MGERQWLGHIAALVTVCGWGLTYVATAILLRSFSPFELPIFRFIAAIPALYLIYPKKMGKTNLRQELLFAGAGLTGVTLFFIAENFALLHSSVSNVGVIVATAPVFTSLAVWIFLKGERPSKAFFLGFLLAICGIALISFADIRIQLSPLGDMLAVVTAMCWAAYSVFMKKINAQGHHPIQITRRIFLYGLLFFGPAVFLTDVRWGFERFLDTANLVSFLLLALGASAAGFVLWNWALAKLGPVKTTVYVYLIPLVALTGSFFILGETISWIQTCGVALTLLGLIISNRRPRKKETAS